MSSMHMNPLNVETIPHEKGNAPYKNTSSLRLIIVVCVLNSLVFIFSLLSIILIARVNYNLSEVFDKVSHISQKLESSTNSETAPTSDSSRQVGSKSLIIHGFDTAKGFNITVEFPDSKFPQSGGELAKILKLVEELHDNHEPGKGGDCRSTGNSGGDVLKALQDVRDSLSTIKNNQGNIMSKLNTSSGVSQTAALQRMESTIVQQTLSVQNRIGDLENIVLQTKSEINSFQKSLADIQTDISQIKFDAGITKLDVGSIKTKTDNLSAKSDCTAELGPILTTVKRDIQNIDSKSEDIQKDVSSLVSGDKSLSSVASTISDRIQRLEAYSSEMKQKCQTSEIKLTEVLAKVGVPTEPPTAKFAQVAISYCSGDTGCNSISVATTHCYKISNTRDFTWTDSRQECKRLGGYLAEIDNEIESREVASMLTQKGNYWIGGNDLAVNRRWQWNYSGKSVSMNVWRSEHPSVIEYLSCMVIGDDGWSWMSMDCDSKAGYVCEKEANDCKDWMSN